MATPSDAEGIDAAEERLRSVVAPAFKWQIDRPSSVVPTYGQWCQVCEFEPICRPER